MAMMRLMACAALLAAAACGRGGNTPDTDHSATTDGRIAVESFELDNGLKVLLHVDRSDPVVAVSLTAHVGSARELPGRTGFAHLFEHLLFLESENLGKGGLDAMSARIGGSGANGSTSRDITNYFQTVPNDALEKMIWAEADKLGWFINTVTDPVLAKEKQVVKNEKRLRVDNQPYGHTRIVVLEALYPKDHPYSWEVIGSLADLDAATLDDVKAFYRAWYGPNNVSLAIAGDFDPASARAMVEKYFSEIPRGPEIARRAPRPAGLGRTVSLFHEDNFAQRPELTLVWPGAEQFHEDQHALAVLTGLLSDGKSAPLNAVLVDEKKLTGSVSMTSAGYELAGEIYLVVRGFDGVDLDDARAAIDEAFARFENEGIRDAAFERVKTRLEVGVYTSKGSVLNKAIAMGVYQAVAGDVAIMNEEINKLRAVTRDDVMRVYARYIKNRPHVATSFVPKGAVSLALAGAERAAVVEEQVVAGAEAPFGEDAAADYARTPSAFDRSKEPPYGPAPKIPAPSVWRAQASNELSLIGVEDRELPMVAFELSMPGGRLLEQSPGAANLLAGVLGRGTAQRTPAEFEEAVALLGAQMSFAALDERFVVSGQTLARNFAATMELMREGLLEPRWDAHEFSLAKARAANSLLDTLSSPEGLADMAFAIVTYGEGHPFATDPRGSRASVEAATIEDLKAYYARAISPEGAALRIAGAASPADVEKATQRLAANWTRKATPFEEPAPAAAPQASVVYFVDVPGAKQSVFRFGRPGPKRADAGYDSAIAANYRLGGGGFAARLMQELRDGKGYSYNIGSSFSGTLRRGEFLLAGNVRSNVTTEAALLVRDLIADYGATFEESDLEATKSFLLKSQARSFESLSAKLGLVRGISEFGLPDDYPRRQAERWSAMTREDVKSIAGALIRADEMRYVIASDAAGQARGLEALGYGPPEMIGDRVRRAIEGAPASASGGE